MTAEEKKEQPVSETAAVPETLPEKKETVPDKPVELKKKEKETEVKTEPKIEPVKKENHPFMNNQYMVLPTGSYFWSLFLFGIPVIGWFICLIVALGGSHYRNKIHFARAFLLYLLLNIVFWGLVAAIIFVLVFGGSTEIITQFGDFLTNSGVGYPTDFTHLSDWVAKLEAVPSVHDFLLQLNEAVGL